MMIKGDGLPGRSCGNAQSHPTVEEVRQTRHTPSAGSASYLPARLGCTVDSSAGYTTGAFQTVQHIP